MTARGRTGWLLGAIVGLPAAWCLAAWVPSAAAAPAPASGSFSMSPVSPAAVTTRRSDFRYQIRPGQVVTDSVQLFNLSAQPEQLEVYATNAYDTPSGTFALEPKGRARTGIGLWTHLPLSETTVPAQSTQTVTFQVSVPSDAPPGDYAGGLVALATTPSSTPTDSKVAVRQGVATAMFIRVVGKLVPAAVVSGVRVHLSVPPFAPLMGTSWARVGVLVHNTGNTDLTGSVNVRVVDIFGHTVKQFAPIPVRVLVPGAEVTTAEPRWRSLPIAGPERVQTSFEALGIGTSTRTTSVWIVPWATAAAAVAGALLIVVVAVYAVLFVLRRGRRDPLVVPARVQPAPASVEPVRSAPEQLKERHAPASVRRGVAVVAGLVAARMAVAAFGRGSGSSAAGTRTGAKGPHGRRPTNAKGRRR